MSDWCEQELGETLVLNYGKSLPKDKRHPGHVPVFGSNGIVGSHSKPLISDEGIIVGRKGSAGEVHNSHVPFFPIDTTFYVGQDDTTLDLRFLFYLLKHLNLKRILGDVGIPGLNREAAYKEAIYYPKSLVEQRTIAAVLGKIKAAIAAQQAIIDRTAELKAALMAKLFTEGTRGEELKETEIGLMPKGWDVVPLSEIASVQRGKFTHRPRNDPAYYGGSIPFIQTGDVTASNGRVTTHSQTLSELGLSVSKLFPKGTILTTIAANIGDFAILDFECAFPDSIVGIQPHAPEQTNYLCYFLQTRREHLNQIAPKGTQKNINLNILEPLPVALPSPHECKVISSLLEAIDQRQLNAMSQRELLIELFSAMLDELMTGRIRVDNLDVAKLGVAADA